VSSEFRSYSTLEVAKRLGVSQQTVQRWVDAGQLKAWKTLGGHRRIEAASAEALFSTQARERSPAATASQASPELRVMLVDDDPLDLELLSSLVRQLAPRALVDTASDGFAALVRMGQTMPDVLITDINMPHMDGFEMIRSLARSDAMRPATIVAVSSLSPSDLAARGRALPDVRFMSKPVDAQDLGRVLSAACEARGITPAA
jgi:excisionase family DNA binding protein